MAGCIAGSGLILYRTSKDTEHLYLVNRIVLPPSGAWTRAKKEVLPQAYTLPVG